MNGSQTAAGSDRRALPEERGDRLAQALLIARRESAERLDHERLLKRREHGLDGRGLEQLRGLPVLNDELPPQTWRVLGVIEALVEEKGEFPGDTAWVKRFSSTS